MLRDTFLGRRHWLRRVGQIASASAVVAGVVALALPRASAQPNYVLDPYPGFGRSADAALRDDTIAYWEAYGRERAIQDCMDGIGFQYFPAVAFPQGAMLEVAKGLGVTESATNPLAPPNERNKIYEATLSAGDREAYNDALFGESAADVERANETGAVPSGRGEDFMTGGCFGQTLELPSIWDVPRALEDQLLEIGAELANSSELRAAYRACVEEKSDTIVAEWPGDVEMIAVQGGAEAPEAHRVLAACDPVWRDARAAAEAAALREFIDRNSDALDTVVANYDGAMDAIQKDPAFLEYLSEEVSLVTGEPADEGNPN